MANCHNLFQKFLTNISLSSTKKNNLLSARDAIRKRIRTYFKDTLQILVPKFHCQGSYSMQTLVAPLDGELDVDDGVYLQHLSAISQKDWPAPETVHSWLVKATENHTNEKPVDKRTCVRVIYAGQYHVDLPSYSLLLGDYMHAEKGDKGWHKSDPRAITQLFNETVEAVGEQLRNNVKYLKAWADNKAQKNGKMASSVILTVLAAQAYRSDQRDDVSFANMAAIISQRVQSSFVVLNPADQTEDLAKRLTTQEKTRFTQLVGQLTVKAQSALAEQSDEKAAKVWQSEFGERFPLPVKENDQAPNIWVKNDDSPPATPVDKKGGGRFG